MVLHTVLSMHLLDSLEVLRPEDDIIERLIHGGHAYMVRQCHCLANFTVTNPPELALARLQVGEVLLQISH